MYKLLIFCISSEARYKEYHQRKLALESRNFCHTPAYLAALLHSSNTKDVKEVMAYIRKKKKKKTLQRFLVREFHHCVEGECFSFSMPLSVEVGVSVAAYSELLDESKFAFFSEFAGR